MKKIAVFFIMLVSIASLIAFAYANISSTSGGDKTTIEMELDKNYDDTDPFINEKLIYVSEDLDVLAGEGTFEMDGESIILEVKDNKTSEVLWSNTCKENVKSEPFSISLENLTKDDEYVLCLTGRKINYASIRITFDSNIVQEREKPLRS